MIFINSLQNLHTHTTFCDGKDTPEEIIIEALNKGFGAIGFSGHSYMHYSPEHSMSQEGTEEYKKEVIRLKEEYKDRIDVFLGIEADMLSMLDYSDYEYSIGSVHYFKIGQEYVGFDRDYISVKNVIENYFGGNADLYAKAYYESVADLYKYGNFDILGHFDLITKHAEKNRLFYEPTEKYFNYAFEALSALKGKIPLFEVNTGAISRGYRTTPYPSVTILKALKEMGYGAVISSDCHDKNYLDCNFKEAEELLEACGFKEKYIFTNQGFKAVRIGEV